MLDSFLTFINQHCPSIREQRCLLCVSGGVDSVVLAKLFYKLRIHCVVAHCNFQLRELESEEDEAFTMTLAERYGFQFVSKKFDVYAAKSATGASTQMAARALRYDWFESLRSELKLDWIVTAHHLDDSFETAILNLVRGTGIVGLRGIAPVNGNLLRPLLYTSRDQILEYAAREQLDWREDSSNASDNYNRNLVRHHIMPVLKKINPSLTNTFKNTSTRLEAADRLLEEMLREWKDTVVSEKNGFLYIRTDEIVAASNCVYRLAFILDPFGFNEDQVAEILARAGNPGKVFFSQSHQLLIDRDYLLVRARENQSAREAVKWKKGESSVKSGELTLTISKEERHSEGLFSTDRTIVYVPWNKLIFPLEIRSWSQGDIFQPYGMGGRRKKVSDILIDLKINLFEKERVQILINGDGEIIWIIGIRADERYRITDQNGPFGVINVTSGFTKF